jgi:hypothetical protein
LTEGGTTTFASPSKITHLGPLPGLLRESLHEVATHLVALPDERADEDLALGPLDLL